MRVIAGQWRGRPLVAPAGDATRPTADRARETLFSMLVSRLGDFAGLRVLDGYAGSGALGLEALSRGAAHATFIERDPAALAAIRANLATLACDTATVTRGDATKPPAAAAPCDLLLLDPPYADDPAAALTALTAAGWAAPAAWASVECKRGAVVACEGWRVDVVRRVGKAQLVLLAR